MGLSGLLWRRLSRVLAMSQPEARAYSGRKSKAPKEPLRHIKNRAKQEAGERHGPAVVYVQVVAAGSRDAGASSMCSQTTTGISLIVARGRRDLCTRTSKSRYLSPVCDLGHVTAPPLLIGHISCSRSSAGVKLSRLDNVFITRMDWANVGGLSGVLLTLRDLGLPKCTLSGPPQLKRFLQAIKTYCGAMDGLTVDVQPYTDPLYSDETMALVKNLWGAPRGLRNPRMKGEQGDRHQLHDRKGHFLVVKAKEMGLPVYVFPQSRTRNSAQLESPSILMICILGGGGGYAVTQRSAHHCLDPRGTREIGPLITQLKAGRSVTYGGKEVTGQIPGLAIGRRLLFIDWSMFWSTSTIRSPLQTSWTQIFPAQPLSWWSVRAKDFIGPVTENAAWKRYQEGKPEAAVSLVIHVTPEHVLNHSTYRQWMESFGPGTDHLLLNEHASTVHNLSSYKVQSQLHLIHPDIFPPLPEIRPPAVSRFSVKDEASTGPGVRAECLLKYQLRPQVGWQRDQVAQNQTCEFVKEAMELPGFGRAVEECRRLLQAEDLPAAEGDAQHPEVVFLGTGSAVPMKTRNVSSTLVHVSSSALLLLDCGEGTFGQLHRHYGDRVDDVLTRLSAVFISHIHADHHTGLLRLVLERERALASLGKPFSPIMVIGPTILMTWLNQYNDSCQEVLHNISFVPSWSLMETSEVDCPKTRGLIAALLETYRLEKFQTCFVRHCKNAFGCAIVHKSGWKLVFSGDTMPCDALVRMGKDASLLIHEATLEDGLEQDAIDKAHSTTSQAIAVGMNMNADFMMLNHFSQRYAKLPLMSNIFSGKVGVSFDHMRIRLRDLQTLPKLIAPLRALFAEDLEELEERKQKREQRLQEPEAPSDSKPVPSAKRDLDDAANMAATDIKRLKAN
ncbi:unnamed protein product [Ranitomeya imitator]|uniref:ribonuclease Z n=1 Tax=Ranitomeya imitator TaxID=111125 RepID=A0ABN9L0P0_9NEOB|nr:unnamed protein product [Ranitomeya imitator]